MQRCLTFDKYNRRFIKTSSSQHLIICASSFVFDYDAPQDKLLDERQNRSPRKAGEQLLGALFSVPTSPPLSTGANVAPTLLRTCVSSQRPPQRTGSPPGPPSSSSLCTVMDTRHHASHVVHISPGDGHRGVAQGYLGSALSSPCRSSMDRTTCDAAAPGPGNRTQTGRRSPQTEV